MSSTKLSPSGTLADRPLLDSGSGSQTFVPELLPSFPDGAPDKADQFSGPLTIGSSPGFYPALRIRRPPVPFPKLAVPYELSAPASLASLMLALESGSCLAAYVDLGVPDAKTGEGVPQDISDHLRGIGCLARIREYTVTASGVAAVLEYGPAIRVTGLSAFDGAAAARVAPVPFTEDSDLSQATMEADTLRRRATALLQSRGDTQRAGALEALSAQPAHYRARNSAFAIASLVDFPPLVKLEVLGAMSGAAQRALVSLGLEHLAAQT